MRAARLALAAVAALGLSVPTLAISALAIPTLAEAKVHITVDLDAQTMHVESKDQTFDWKVSTGKEGYETPAGTYGVLWMDKDHHSDEYEGAAMPNAIFFKPGFAIHGFSRSPWGHAASHGCIRLPVAKSAILFNLVKAEGAEVEIVGDTPATVASERPRRQDEYAGYERPDPYARGGAGYSRGYEPRDYEYLRAAPQRENDLGDPMSQGLY